MKKLLLPATCILGLVALSVWSEPLAQTDVQSQPQARKLMMEPIGRIHKSDNNTWVEIDPRFQEGLLGLDDFSHVWVFWWFDQNDTREQRRTLQVHPRGNRRNPLTGVFATRSPVRPNLIALTLCEIRSVKENRIILADIDAFDETPVVDLKPYIPSIDRPTNVRLPSWLTRNTVSERTQPSEP